MTQGSSKSQTACRFSTPTHGSADGRGALSRAVAQAADEDSDDYPDMSHITSSMDQLALLDDDLLSLTLDAPPAATQASFDALGGFDFTSEPPREPAGRMRRSLLPSFLLDELDDSEEDTPPAEPVVSFGRASSAAPVLSARAASGSTPTPSPSPSPVGAERAHRPENDSDAAHQLHVEEPNFDDFEEAVAVPAPAETPARSSAPAADELCAFSILGKCRYGSYCRNLHGLQCPRCLLYILHPTDTERNEAHLAECLSRPETNTYSNLHQIKCGLCHESVLQGVDPRFGLLNCNHPFCLACIRAWRLANFDANDEASSSCPQCTQVTYFIVPSSTWIEDAAEKQRVIDQYKKKMSLIPCKYHDSGRGCCPFGSSCFYEHRNDHVADSVAEAARAAYRQTVTEQNERLAKAREAKLSDYIVFKSVSSLGKKIKRNS